MTTENNLEESRSGVRSYRGRTLEELLPQIRAELGADAVILHEREGLAGGVGGFFAQRCIEVDARRRGGQLISPPTPPAVTPPPPGFARNPARESPPPAQAPPTPADAQAEVDSALAGLAQPARKPRPLHARPKPPEARAPSTPRAERTPPPPRRPARFLAAAEPEPVKADAQIAPGAPAPVPAPVPATAPAPAPAPAPAATPAPAPTPAPPVANPYASVRERPAAPPVPPPRPSLPAPQLRPSQAGSGIGPRKYTAPPPAVAIEPARRRGSGNIFRAALSRLLGRPREIVLRPPPPQPLDVVAAAEVAESLSARGASQTWTSELISAVGAHGNPLTGSLRAAAEAELARRILPAPPLPAEGAAVAFVGGGGSGKTRCTAAMASAYRRGSTLTVMVLALDNPDGARELRKLLAEDGVPVVSLSSDRAQQAIEVGRQGGLVIVDTAAATPTDPSAVDALRAKLEPLGLDATYVTLPATLGPSAARRVLASFGSLSPAAVTITHADETDQLAVVVEIAISHRIPLAYFHSGTDHTNALSAVDPPAIAHELLP